MWGGAGAREQRLHKKMRGREGIGARLTEERERINRGYITDERGRGSIGYKH